MEMKTMMVNKQRQRLGDILINNGYITSNQLEEGLAEHRRTKRPLGEIFVKKGYLSESILIEVLEFQLGIPHVILAKRRIDPEVLRLVPEQVARKYHVFPVEKQGNHLALGMLDPTNVAVFDELRLTLKMDIIPFIVIEDDLNRAINQYYGVNSSFQEVFKDLDIEIDEQTEPETDTSQAVDDAPIVRLVNLIITQAVKEHASDIHLEPTDGDLSIRYRVDGKLKQFMTSPKNTQATIISRIKIISGMNIAEKRIPQDGRIQMKVENSPIDIRVSSIPTIFGEKVVMRLLFKNNILARLESLGFLPDSLEKFRAIYKQPYGIILVTGPTGSGKSTTLSSVLNELNSREDNIMTVEDPVEYQIPGVNQVQVNTKAGLTFASALRSFLRQDPDIIMVGEIRDQETAQIAIQAALTGHLVLSTLHTNDAPSTITRLIDMGVEPFLVASTLIGVLAQRLVRGICPGCKTQYTLEPSDVHFQIVKDNLPDLAPDKMIFYKGAGCRQCNNTGYARRLAIHEILLLNQEVRSIISRSASFGELREAGLRAGMRTLLQDGLIKATEGRTTIEEVVKVAYTSAN
jgi:type IV pilus assembly protein PilB